MGKKNKDMEYLKVTMGINLDNKLSEDIKKMYLNSNKYDLGQSYKYALNILKTLKIQVNNDLIQGLLEYSFYNMNPIALKSIWYVMGINEIFKNDLRDTLLKYSVNTYKYLVDIDYYLQDSLGYEFLSKEADWMFDKTGYQHKVGGYFLAKEFTKGDAQKIIYIGKKNNRYTVIYQDSAIKIKSVTIENRQIIEEKYIERVIVFLSNPFENSEMSNELVYTIGIEDIPIDLDWMFNIE